MEEREQSGAVRLTTRESAIRDGGSSDPILSVHEMFPDSQNAISGLVAEEELDYEEDILVSGEQALAVQQATTSGRAVQGDRLSGRRGVATNLLRVAEIPWACTGSGCTEDSGFQAVMGIRRERMLQLVQQSVAPSTRKSYKQAWLDFLRLCRVPDGGCTVWIVGHSFVRWAEKQAASRHFGKQLGLDGAKIRISWVGLLKAMKMDFLRIKERWAGTHIVWTGLVPRKLADVPLQDLQRSLLLFHEVELEQENLL
ncbi:hypothetical protein NDU88_004794 [Pleurodeles waltl]|uniref:Uncharacterized protein n=1 Tax=Pleurodeles waltl TaxID=8319 RepID=A0AAV7MY88_PLEWA|nr:hypothetical protein NDU88_004794 [Pleurodeles waltl]